MTRAHERICTKNCAERSALKLMPMTTTLTWLSKTAWNYGYDCDYGWLTTTMTMAMAMTEHD